MADDTSNSSSRRLIVPALIYIYICVCVCASVCVCVWVYVLIYMWVSVWQWVIKSFQKENSKVRIINPLTLSAAKSSLTILSKSFKWKQSLENIWRRNIYQNILNICIINSHFQSYHKKYRRSIQKYLEKHVSSNGLTIKLGKKEG